MKCADPRCTGQHNDRQWATLCPRTKDSKLASGRRYYDRLTELQHARNVMRARRIRALQRIERRHGGAVSQQG